MIETKLLDQRHPEHAEHAEAWDDIELLHRGGHCLKRRAERFLLRRPKELEDVYRARLDRFTYQNILGTGLGWYLAAMFEREPEILIRRGGEELAEKDQEFFGRFLADCNRAGRSFSDLFSDVFLSMALYRSAFVLTDLQKAVPVGTLAEQRAVGGLDPYLTLWDPRQVINWDVDAHGNLTWVVLRATEDERAFGEKPRSLDRWYFFDRVSYRLYEAERDKNGKTAETAALVDEGPHALAEIGRVPVRRVVIPEILWLADRVYLQVLDHLNQDNSYGWALFMANLPIPVIKGEFEQPPKVSETAFIHLQENGAFEWAEPSGTSFQNSAARIASLREEIYRQMYLQAQGRTSEATPAAQSGFSKELDMAPAADVLNKFGDVLRGAMRDVLRDVADVRGDRDVTFDVRGFDFSDDDTANEVRTAQNALSLEIPSNTFEKEVQKRAARVVLKDALPEIVQRVEGEIDAAPTREEREAAEETKRREEIRSSLSGMAGRPIGRAA